MTSGRMMFIPSFMKSCHFVKAFGRGHDIAESCVDNLQM
jgi:hypothetical protein